MLVDFNSELDLKVLLKLLSAVYLIKNELKVFCRVDKVEKLLLALLESLVELPDVCLALNNVKELRIPYLLFHLIEHGLDLEILFLHECLLVIQSLEEQDLVLLLLSKLDPEVLLNTTKFSEGQFKELLGSDLFFLIEIPS